MGNHFLVFCDHGSFVGFVSLLLRVQNACAEQDFSAGHHPQQVLFIVVARCLIRALPSS